MITEAEQEAHAALAAIEASSSLESLPELHTKILGKKSPWKGYMKALKAETPEVKREVAPHVQELRKKVQEAFDARQASLTQEHVQQKINEEWLDVTRPFERHEGTIHPISQIQREVEDLFTSMGFMIADGLEIETEWHNFDALNVPGTHPARDMQDTFWISNDHEDPLENLVLRTQTSNAQVRMMQEHGAPIRMIAPGRVFRNEDVDTTHDMVFYQVEGLVVDENITLGDLKGTIEILLKTVLKQDDVKVRFRPGYFPFVEPGLEVDLWWEYIDKDGNKKGKWLEMMGAGMVHPNVLKNGGIDPRKYQGFAFGVGLTRLVMMNHGVEDIRHFFLSKDQFLKQFPKI